jgi:hypothetical protein
MLFELLKSMFWQLAIQKLRKKQLDGILGRQKLLLRVQDMTMATT